MVKKYILEGVIFFCGAIGMILELTGSRILAPYFGTSILVWTNIIGLILGSLSLGYYLGGRIADKQANYKILSIIILTAAGSVFLAAFSHQYFLYSISSLIHDLRLGSFIATLILFAPASVALGMVSPYVVKLKMQDLKNTGKTVGNLYALSTIGSIAGTFLSGFILIATLGSTIILFILSVALVLISLITNISYYKIKTGLILILLISIGIFNQIKRERESRGFIDIDTQYQRIQIFQGIDAKNNEPARYLRTDPLSVQSAMYLNSNDLVFDYTKFYNLFKYFNPEAKRTLMIGGAGYSYPKYYLENFPNLTMDVVEIDPMMTKLAKKYFRLQDNPRLKINHEDGRVFLNRTKNKYDAVLGDAFNAHTPPFQLTTKEATQKIYDLLNPEGVAIVNLISSLSGGKSKFLEAEYATYKAVFPQVYLFPVNGQNNLERTQNIILVALKTGKNPQLNIQNPEFDQYLKNIYYLPTNQKPLPILTDEKAPVENYTLNFY